MITIMIKVNNKQQDYLQDDGGRLLWLSLWHCLALLTELLAQLSAKSTDFSFLFQYNCFTMYLISAGMGFTL